MRWQAFPLRVLIEESELLRRGYTASRTAQISRLILQGLGSWAAATGQVGSITQVTDVSVSTLNVVFRTSRGDTIHDSRQGEFVTHATILMDPASLEQFGSPFTNRIAGVSFTDGADHRWNNAMAHEMGHVLGIVAHPATPGSLMINEAEQLIYERPQAVDVNSILKKYQLCS